MNRKIKRKISRGAGVSALRAGMLLALGSVGAQAAIDGISGTTFNMTAKVDQISTADGGSVLLWGYADDGSSNNGRAQYPAPTLIVNQGDTITINLKNGLTVAAGAVPNVSMVFPGQDVTVSCTDGTVDTCPAGPAVPVCPHH
jgi:FtsP/CotA-like multicopper oxidase with cupredoxin domain